MFKLWRKWVPLLLGVALMVVLAQPAQPQIPNLNFITSLVPVGEVKFKKASWPKFQPASIGSILGSEDHLLVGSQAMVEVLCSNLSTWRPQSGKTSIVSEGCPATGRTRFNRSTDRTPPARAINNPKVPYIISPRDTKIREGRLTLKWNAVEGVNRYTVSLLGAISDFNWTEETSVTEIVYPGNPPLEPGAYYWLTVEAENGFSSTSEGVFGFRLLNQEQEVALAQEIEELSQKQLGKEANDLALAYLYYNQGLKQEAIDQLEQSLEQGNTLVATYELLGSIYQEVGLLRRAKERYLGGLARAKATSDIVYQAEIEKGLMWVTRVIDGREEAIGWLEKALRSYEAIGDAAEIRQLEEERNNL
ncbi:MAG: hypothetical protein J7540_01210 [Roseofilum sp. SID2]|uniref:tetratricopeptide repeat protein n=1 Tax=Roseofilum sp. SID2 TaxID=2821498 RepID=UPI001AFDBFA7|nr:hypothetical protein [Roseofilum sp. SID2]MBP0022608.1 hypothetical protein [Roseofilum sp. SID2]